MGRNKHLTSSHWVGPIIICSFGAHQPSLISHTAPRWPSLSNSTQFSFNYDSADPKKYCSLLSKTLNCHSPKDWFLTGNKCPKEMVLCPTQSKAGVGGAVLLFFWGIPASQLSLSQWKFYFVQRADHLQYYRNGLGLAFLTFFLRLKGSFTWSANPELY